MGAPRLFRKLAGTATRLFSKVKDNAPAIFSKVSDISGQIGKGLNQGAPIVSSIGVATGQPEIVALGGAMKAGAIGANKLSQVSKQGSIMADKNADPLQRARAGAQLGKQIYY